MRSTHLLALAAAAATTFALVASPGLAAEAAPTAVGTTVAASPGTGVRFATFNVRTARADIGTSRHWLKRALSVAREIKSQDPGIVSIQELGPGRADGTMAPSALRPARPRACRRPSAALAPASTSWPGPRRM